MGRGRPATLPEDGCSKRARSGFGPLPTRVQRDATTPARGRPASGTGTEVDSAHLELNDQPTDRARGRQTHASPRTPPPDVALVTGPMPTPPVFEEDVAVP